MKRIKRVYALDQRIVTLIQEDAQNDPASPGNENAVVRRILNTHYADRLRAKRVEKVAYKSTSSDYGASSKPSEVAP